MTRREINQFNMILSVDDYLSSNAEVLTDFPVVNQATAQLQTYAGSIRITTEKQGITTLGQTALKKTERLQLADTAVKVLDALKAHAAATANVRLKAMMAQYVPSKFKTMRESNLLTAVKQIYNEAEPIQSNLEIWGINNDDIKALNTSNIPLPQRSSAIRGTQAVHKQATVELKQTINQATDLLKNTIDPMMLPFRTINPTFYGEYKVTRLIINKTATQQTQTQTPAKTE